MLLSCAGCLCCPGVSLSVCPLINMLHTRPRLLQHSSQRTKLVRLSGCILVIEGYIRFLGGNRGWDSKENNRKGGRGDWTRLLVGALLLDHGLRKVFVNVLFCLCFDCCRCVALCSVCCCVVLCTVKKVIQCVIVRQPAAIGVWIWAYNFSWTNIHSQVWIACSLNLQF